MITVKEGINLPRYPSLPGRLRAKRAALEQYQPPWQPEGLRKRTLRVPDQPRQEATVLGTGDGRGARPGPAAGRTGGAEMSVLT